MEDLDFIDVTQYDCVIVDEAQFLTREQVLKLVEVVDEKNVPVICYGLRADFKGDLFPGSACLMAWADAIEEIKTVCWCGKKATFNARIQDGRVVKEGEQVQLGGNERYVSLCRKHWGEGALGGRGIRRVDAGREDYRDMLLDADPDWTMVEKYLYKGEMYVLTEGGEGIAEAVITRREDGCLEIKNLATAEGYRKTGCARQLLQHIRALYPSEKIYVGTCENLRAFYEKMGFAYAYTVRNFFTDNYSEPVYDEGMLCRDMLYFLLKPHS